ncbi:unnamed protein product, partial [marine sediment metagenome]
GSALGLINFFIKPGFKNDYFAFKDVNLWSFQFSNQYGHGLDCGYFISRISYPGDYSSLLDNRHYLGSKPSPGSLPA